MPAAPCCSRYVLAPWLTDAGLESAELIAPLGGSSSAPDGGPSGTTQPALSPYDDPTVVQPATLADVAMWMMQAAAPGGTPVVLLDVRSRDEWAKG